VVRHTAVGVHTTFHLPASVDAFYAGLSKSQRNNFRRYFKALSHDFIVTAETLRDANEAVQQYQRFKELHTAQWRSEGKLGHFGDWPGSESFNDELVRTFAQQGRFRLFRLTANGEPICFYYSLVFGDTCYARLPARALGNQWEKFSLGRLGLIKMIESVIDEGIRHIEAGPGHYEYKLQLGAVETPLTSVLLASNRMDKHARTYLFSRAAELLHLLYYRIWFGRIAPRLLLPRRPLWKSWIRSRF
jgi:CelD/BcsL family acetyltransferase involved in cellulose biosynthesis